MFIDICAIGFAPTDAIRNHVEYRLAAALGWAGDAIGRVTVRLDDINADRGGIDKRCRIVAEARRPAGMLLADVVSNDLYAAIDEATTRVRQVARRRLSRRLTMQRKDPQRPGTLIPAGTG
jgi:ribosome-associated translation inhibitor RaiA